MEIRQVAWHARVPVKPQLPLQAPLSLLWEPYRRLFLPNISPPPPPATLVPHGSPSVPSTNCWFASWLPLLLLLSLSLHHLLISWFRWGRNSRKTYLGVLALSVSRGFCHRVTGMTAAGAGVAKAAHASRISCGSRVSLGGLPVWAGLGFLEAWRPQGSLVASWKVGALCEQGGNCNPSRTCQKSLRGPSVVLYLSNGSQKPAGFQRGREHSLRLFMGGVSKSYCERKR